MQSLEIARSRDAETAYLKLSVTKQPLGDMDP